MGLGRQETMNPLEIETHHCWTRCVRRMYLLGFDPLTGKDYTYRRERLFGLHEYLASVLAVDVGALNVMTNHLHDILRSRPDIVQRMADEEVVWRYRKAWPRYYGGHRKWDYDPTDKELERMLKRAKDEPKYMPRLRRSLSDISFFLGRLKETISKQANKEKPNNGGHFWDGPYGNRKIETNEDTIASVLYCDLQQPKAGMVDRLEDSSFSSIQAQIRARAEQAFIDVHEREPGEEDGAELEHLQQLFANGWFSPLTLDGPLITESDEEPPASELVLPAGYCYQQTADAVEDTVESAAKSNDSASSQSPKRRRGRPKKKRKRSIHERLKRKQRRRASRCNLLGLSWEEYSPVVHRLAEQLINDRRGPSLAASSSRSGQPQGQGDPPSAPSTVAEAGAGSDPSTGGAAPAIPSVTVPATAVADDDAGVPADATATKFQRAFKDFTRWLATDAKESFAQLLAIRSARPRAPDKPT